MMTDNLNDNQVRMNKDSDRIKLLEELLFATTKEFEFLVRLAEMDAKHEAVWHDMIAKNKEVIPSMYSAEISELSQSSSRRELQLTNSGAGGGSKIQKAYTLGYMDCSKKLNYNNPYNRYNPYDRDLEIALFEAYYEGYYSVWGEG